MRGTPTGVSCRERHRLYEVRQPLAGEYVICCGMAYDSLRDFVQKLAAAGELKRIPVEVDPILEITEIADREMKLPQGGKALLFEKCKGSQFPLLINAYGSVKRMALALGVEDVNDIARELRGLLKAKPPTSFKEAIALLGTADRKSVTSG